MENLHPKSPTMAADNILTWPNFQPPEPAMEPNNPSWADDFVGFSTVKRRAHRRSISDISMAFTEEPTTTLVEFQGPPETKASGGGGPFEMRLDSEAQLIMSMLNNEHLNRSASSSSVDPASSSTAAQKRRRLEEREEAESFKCFNDDVDGDQPPCQGDRQTLEGTEVVPPSPAGGSSEAVNDPKRVKRILANRQSAQRSRVRKLQYISELERSLTRLQTEVSMLSPRVAFVDHQRMMLNVDNAALKSKIAALSHDKFFKDAHQEALKREIERLKQVYHQQSSADDTTAPTPDP